MKNIVIFLISCAIFSSAFGQRKIVNASHYLFPEFTKGVVLVKSGEKVDYLLNYNALTEEMIFDKKGNKLAIGTDEMAKIDTVSILNRKFVPIENKFLEIVYKEKSELFIAHKCNIEEKDKKDSYGRTSHSSSTHTISTLIKGRASYEISSLDAYKKTPFIRYWLKRNGEFTMFKSIRQLKNLYSDKKGALKDYMKKNNVKYSDTESMINLIKYLESN